MKSLLSLKTAVLICTTVLLALTLSSWKDMAGEPQENTRDTVPGQRMKKMRDSDEAAERRAATRHDEDEDNDDDENDNDNNDKDDSDEVADGNADDIDVVEVDIDKDWEDNDRDRSAIEQDLNKAMQELNENLQEMNVDLQAMNQDLQRSMHEIDFENLQDDIEASVAKVDMEALQESIESVKSINLENIRQNLEVAKEQLDKLQPELERSMKASRESLEKAKANLRGYKSFIEELEDDGLIDKREGYTVEHRDGQLLINGKAQSRDVYNRHRSFLEKNERFTIRENEPSRSRSRTD
jgi:hypothetical protein